MAEKTKNTKNEINDKLRELKIELLKQPTKKKTIKKEIAKLLTLEKIKQGDKK